MKILFFSPYYYPYISGITVFPRRVLSDLASKNVVTVLTFPHKKLISQEFIDNVRIIRMPFLFRVSKGFISPQSMWYFFKQLRDADVVILNVPNVEGLWLALMAKLSRKPLISLFHCDVVLGKKLHLYLIERVLRLVVNLQLRLSTRIIVTTMDYVENISWFSKKMLHKTTAIVPPINELPVNEDEINYFRKQKGQDYWIGYIGRISEEKGIEYVIKAVETLQHQFPCKLVIAGPAAHEVVGESHYANLIDLKLKSSGINYYHYGKLSLSQLGAFYKTCDVVVIPSVNKTEALSLTQIEAMIMGTPVIVSALPGIRFPVMATNAGILVEPKNSSAISQAVVNIRNNKQQFRSSDVSKKVKAVFNAADSQKQYETFIKRCISESVSQ